MRRRVSGCWRHVHARWRLHVRLFHLPELPGHDRVSAEHPVSRGMHRLPGMQRGHRLLEGERLLDRVHRHRVQQADRVRWEQLHGSMWRRSVPGRHHLQRVELQHRVQRLLRVRRQRDDDLRFEHDLLHGQRLVLRPGRVLRLVVRRVLQAVQPDVRRRAELHRLDVRGGRGPLPLTSASLIA